MMQSGVYIIRNTVSGKFYVGSSALMHERREQHFYALAHEKHHNRHLQFAYKKHGAAAFVFDVLEYCATAVMYEREQHWIDTLRACDEGYNIARVVVASMTGLKHSDEARAQMSAKRKGTKQTPEHIANLAAARRGLKRSAEFCKANSERMKASGRVPVLGDAARAKISAAHKGKIVSDETKAKMSAARRARGPQTEQQKQRASETMKKRWADKEHAAKHKAAITANNTGKKRSAETCAKISAHRVAYWDKKLGRAA